MAVGTRIEDGRAVLEVRDDGPGIAEEDRDRIFDRFYRADPARERGGSGLGLPLTRAIVLLHGGEIGVTSTLRLPFVSLPKETSPSISLMMA